MEGVTITLSPEKSESLFEDALANAVGTGYYMTGYGIELETNDKDYTKARQTLKDKGESPSLEDIWMQILRDGNALTFEDVEGEGDQTKVITMKDVHEKVQNTPMENLAALLNEDGDAGDADILMQTVLYGSVIFG